MESKSLMVLEMVNISMVILVSSPDFFGYLPELGGASAAGSSRSRISLRSTRYVGIGHSSREDVKWRWGANTREAGREKEDRYNRTRFTDSHSRYYS